ncbi:gamma-glutamyl-gamma-aminobutyrate hydrolase family protein [soil metagenome]|jgi:putative glutamine amidotransferase
MTPVIGVTATLKEDGEAPAPGEVSRPLGEYVRADLDYVEGVFDAGGAPIVLPPIGGARNVESLVGAMDGLLLSGGSDLDPKYYGEAGIPEMGATIPERDEFEMALVGAALRRGIPIFGICRGLQVLNVALGGTLYQDISAQLGDDALSHRQTALKFQPAHEVEVRSGSWVGEAMGETGVKVNSYHHQAVKELAPGLVVSASSPDGVIEAVESRDFSDQWLFGVQWHAEAMRTVGVEHRNLFAALVSAAENHAVRRAAA